ncbi:DUF2848 domain-containing protein [Caballeronia mineralivorans]|jgi:hypothetical protein|uniref:DUF2848 domain-containing protein n=1 Tax=Caballeronia mineralivorans TaxID=2010198 RepID=UPI0023F3E0CF|nr:DUF2848 domain-containing protein [Caballeronia mineralivorans]MDB5786457.1 hypothetical protein [Caballeronia mineralivorans]MEA3096656.1 hypothetical protein [Caballeronia mineralivorans]
MKTLECRIDRGAGIEIIVSRLVIAGWAGRDARDVEHHIRELEALGVKRPALVPTFYRITADLLTTSERIDVVGTHSSGEVEVVLIQTASDGLLVGIGSDHTDRRVESYDVAVSKQMCAKPVSATLWRYADIASHWDSLIARSWRIGGDADRVLYQEGTLARLLHPEGLIERGFGAGGMPPGSAMFCGTQAVLGHLSASAGYELELHDPVLGRSLRHRYMVEALAHVE